MVATEETDGPASYLLYRISIADFLPYLFFLPYYNNHLIPRRTITTDETDESSQFPRHTSLFTYPLQYRPARQKFFTNFTAKDPLPIYRCTQNKTILLPTSTTHNYFIFYFYLFIYLFFRGATMSQKNLQLLPDYTGARSTPQLAHDTVGTYYSFTKSTLDITPKQEELLRLTTQLFSGKCLKLNQCATVYSCLNNTEKIEEQGLLGILWSNLRKRLTILKTHEPGKC